MVRGGPYILNPLTGRKKGILENSTVALYVRVSLFLAMHHGLGIVWLRFPRVTGLTCQQPVREWPGAASSMASACSASPWQKNISEKLSYFSAITRSL